VSRLDGLTMLPAPTCNGWCTPYRYLRTCTLNCENN